MAQPRRFGFGTGLMAGLFGAGLLGMLLGNGFFGGLAGLASILGLLLQIGLVVLLVSFAMKWFRTAPAAGLCRRGQGYARSMGGSVPPAGRTAHDRRSWRRLGGGLGGGLGGALGGASAARTQRAGPSGRARRDRHRRARLRRLRAGPRRDAGRLFPRDVAKLWTLATPEMAGYIQEELNDNAARGVVNKLSNVRLVQGDLAEAWREGAHGLRHRRHALRASPT